MTDDGLQLSRSAAVRLLVPCSLHEIRPAARRLCGFLREQGLQPEEIQACELAVVEACNNAVDYASPAGRLEKIHIDVLCDSAKVELRVRDHTPGFNWPNQVELPAPTEERGRGLFLIHSLMDDVGYFRGQGSNCLILQRQRSKPPVQSPIQDSVLDQLSQRLKESEQIISDMAEELSFCYESLSAIFRCSAELGRTRNLKEFAQRLLTDLAQITSADWFVLRLVSRDGTTLGVFCASESGLKLPALRMGVAGESLPTLEMKAAVARQDCWLEGSALAEPGEPLAAVAAGSSGLVHPFSLADQLVGTIAIGKAAGRPPFTAVQANVVHTFSDFLGIQIANARFQEEQLHARLVSRELEIAKNIQRSLLPKSLPQVPGFELAGFCESAQQVGGDFYDVVRFNETSLLLVVADVMGKGMPAAMFAAILRSLLRAAPEWTDQPAHLLSRVNRLLFKELSGVDMFITAQLAFVDTTDQRLVVASAGHCPALLSSDGGGTVRTISPEGVPLGILPDTSFGAQVEQLAQDSCLLLYTDGLTEARNPEGQFFGQERLLDWFRSSLPQRGSADHLRDQLASELGKFQATTELQDDQTFLIMA